MNKIKLTKLSKKELDKIRGGYRFWNGLYPEGNCTCGCYYSGSGGSSIEDNGSANMRGGLSSIPYPPPQ